MKRRVGEKRGEVKRDYIRDYYRLRVGSFLLFFSRLRGNREVRGQEGGGQKGWHEGKTSFVLSG